jgi:hypothetical protein
LNFPPLVYVPQRGDFIMAKITERVGRLLNAVESRWSLYTLIQGSGVIASFGLPAWAVKSAQIFSQYAPLSWVVAGFVGVLLWSVTRLIWNWAYQIKIRAQYDARFLERSGNYNPLDLTFEKKRIYLDDFALPSHTIINGKTFIQCEIIGPASVYFAGSNNAVDIRPPIIDGVWLHPDARYNAGFQFHNCIFRDCSFQRVTMFASIENFELWNNNTSVNWIGVPPTPELIEKRRADLPPKGTQPSTPIATPQGEPQLTPVLRRPVEPAP